MSWDRDRLLMELGAFSFGAQSEGEELSRYRAFYNQNFEDVDGLDSSLGWLDSGDFRLVLQVYRIAEACGTVFVFHGYFDHAGIYQHLIRFLLGLGYNVVIYDMPGHGLSSGKRTSINDFQQYQDALSRVLELCDGQLSTPFHAIGQSTGAAVVIDRMSAADAPDVFDRVVLLAPLVRPAGWLGVQWLHSAVSPFFEVWRRSFSVNSTDSHFIEFLKKQDPLQSKTLSVDWVGALKNWVPDIEARIPVERPVSVVQGLADRTVEWQHNIPVLRRLFRQVKVSYVAGGHHHLVNESEEKRQQVFSVIRQELGCS